MYQAVMQQAALDIEVGFLAQAKALIQSVHDLSVIPRKHPDKAVLLWHKARLYLYMYDFKEAREALEAASRQLAGSGLGSDAKRGLDRQNRLALACQHVATKHVRRPMIVKFLKTIVPLSWQLLDRQNALHPLRLRFAALDAALLVQEGKLSQAEDMLAALIERYREQSDSDSASALSDKTSAAGMANPLVGNCKTSLAQIAYVDGRFEDAQALFVEAQACKVGEWLELSLIHI